MKKKNQIDGRLGLYLLFLAHTVGIASGNSYHHLNIGDGLSQNGIQCMLQDHTGFMWFGTEDGLNRYDGYAFEIFRNDPWDSTSISGNDIASLCQDRWGRFWVGTKGGGLNVYHCHENNFIRIPLVANPLNTLGYDSVHAIIEDATGKLWIGTAAGLYSVDLNTVDTLVDLRTLPAMLNFNHIKASDDSTGLTHARITCLMADRSGFIWIGTEWGLNALNPATGLLHHYYYSDHNPCGLWSNFIRCIMQDKNGILWVGTELGGLNRMTLTPNTEGQSDWDRLKSCRFVYHMPNKAKPNHISNDVVLSMVEDAFGNFWIGTEEGLNLMNRDAETFEQIRSHPDFSDGLNSNVIYSIYQDRSRLLWIGTDQGLNTRHLFQNQFKHIRHEPGQSNSLSHPYVWGIQEDDQQNLYIATSNGLSVYSRNSDRFTIYRNDETDPRSLAADNIMTLLIDSRGMLWAGLNGGGLDYAPIRPGQRLRFRHVKYDPETDQALQDEYVTTLYEDPDGHIWYATWSGHLTKLVFDPEGDPNHGFPYRFVHYGFCLRPDSQSVVRRVNTIRQDNAGNLWAGTAGNGIFKIPSAMAASLNPTRIEDRVIQYAHEPGNLESLNNNFVLDIYEDESGILWISTYGGGMNRLDPATGRFRHYTMKNGLSNNVVYGILEDGDQRLWLSTNNGINRFDPETEEVRRFSVLDGLQGLEFNANAFYQNSRGEMFFGGLNGMNLFHPVRIQSNLYIPPVVIHQFQLLDNTARFHLNCSSEEPDRIELNHKQDGFTLCFTALNFIRPEKNQYRYRMHPVETAWRTAGPDRSATYARLAPGEYRFEVQGSNNHGIWNPRSQNLHISIAPPFWNTTGFQMLLTLLFAGCLFLIYFLRIRSIRSRNRLLEIRVQERTEALAAANKELRAAIDAVACLEGLLPICAGCKKIRDDKGYWHQVENYIRKHTNVQFSHGLCPDCTSQYFPDELMNGDQGDPTS